MNPPKRIKLSARKEYLATVPWVRVLHTPVRCGGWNGATRGKTPCKNPAYYRFKHHKGRKTTYFRCLHEGETVDYCWWHLLYRGLYGDHCEEARFDRWQKKCPPPWKNGTS